MGLSFYKGKRVLVTGHTGFKGAWMCRVLVDAGAILTGYSLEAPTQPNLFALAEGEEKIGAVDIAIEGGTVTFGFDNGGQRCVRTLTVGEEI